VSNRLATNTIHDHHITGMNMELKIFESPGTEWDEFASRHTDLVFYQSIWSEVLRKGLGGQPLYFYLMDGGGMVAGLPGILLNFKMIRILYASIPYGNMMGDPAYFPSFMDLLDQEFKKKGIDQVRITESPFSKSCQLPSFKPLLAKCTLLDLRGLDKEKIWEGYRKNIRRDVRKAQKSGVVIRHGASIEDVRIFWKLYLASMGRNRAMAKYPLQWFEILYEMIIKRKLGTVALAEVNNEAIAGAIFIHSKTSTHYFHNGSQYEFLKFCPNELLIHNALEEAIEKKHSSFDFMGSDPLDLPLLHFKEKWGSQSMDLHTYAKDYHPMKCKIWELGKRAMNSSVGSWLFRKIRG
jgi:Acetyltransferase (GNAT) domain